MKPLRAPTCFGDIDQSFIEFPVMSEYFITCINCIPPKLEIGWHIVFVALYCHLFVALFQIR